MSYHCPPKVLTTVVSEANRSPQPGLPRRQIPARSSVLSCLANWATCSQVGRSGISMPASANMSLRYIRNDDSP